MTNECRQLPVELQSLVGFYDGDKMPLISPLLPKNIESDEFGISFTNAYKSYLHKFL